MSYFTAMVPNCDLGLWYKRDEDLLLISEAVTQWAQWTIMQWLLVFPSSTVSSSLYRGKDACPWNLGFRAFPTMQQCVLLLGCCTDGDWHKITVSLVTHLRIQPCVSSRDRTENKLTATAFFLAITFFKYLSKCCCWT